MCTISLSGKGSCDIFVKLCKQCIPGILSKLLFDYAFSHTQRVAIGFYMSLKIFVGEEGISFCHGLCALTKNGVEGFSSDITFVSF